MLVGVRPHSSPVAVSVVRLLMLLAGLNDSANAIRWLAVAKHKLVDSNWNSVSECHRKSTAEGFDRLQRQHCARKLDLMPAVVMASHQAALVCQELFYDRRWNCSSVLLAPRFGPDLRTGTREQGFLYALTSASLTQAVAKTCSAGLSVHCGCSVERGETTAQAADVETYQWRGCADDVQFAAGFATSFLIDENDSPQQFHQQAKKKNRLLMLDSMNKHNYRVGIRTTMLSLSTSCKCHGVSGSCTVKTCWRSLPDLRNPGAVLLQAYHHRAVWLRTRARRPRPQQHDGERHSLTSAAGLFGEDTVQTSSESTLMVAEDATQLVYLATSPDHCLPDTSLGSVGTRGRLCQPNARQPLSTHTTSQPHQLGDAEPASVLADATHAHNRRTGNCTSLCCGRGHNTRTVDIEYRCQCKYHWCCYVKCKTCVAQVQVASCR